MRYISTRGGVAPITFSQAVMMGLATDGGLLLPESIPTVTPDTLRLWAGLPFQSLSLEVMTPFVGDDLPQADLKRLIDRSYSTFTHPEITPVVPVGALHILELFHGPTLAFKDVALQFLGNLFEYFLAKSGERLNILGATSGDTGSAAIHGVRGKSGIEIFIIHPHKKVSLVQERQMTTVLDANVHNIAIEGDFDDGQRLVKALFNDIAFKEEYRLGAVNSINWARILAQVVYYFYAWGRVSGGDPDRQVTFSVPTGNFGDIFAGYVASRMGLPIKRLLLATNQNDILARFVNEGNYHPAGTVRPSMSPSMDILVASNFERYLYYLLDESPGFVVSALQLQSTGGGITIDEPLRKKVASLFQATRVDEEETLAQIRRTHAEEGYLLDPHTAVGVAAARNHPGAICLATAHPAKFKDAVYRAIGQEPPLPPGWEDLLQRPHRLAVLPADSQAIKAFMQERLS